MKNSVIPQSKNSMFSKPQTSKFLKFPKRLLKYLFPFYCRLNLVSIWTFAFCCSFWFLGLVSICRMLPFIAFCCSSLLFLVFEIKSILSKKSKQANARYGFLLLVFVLCGCFHLSIPFLVVTF